MDNIWVLGKIFSIFKINSHFNTCGFHEQKEQNEEQRQLFRKCQSHFMMEYREFFPKNEKYDIIFFNKFLKWHIILREYNFLLVKSLFKNGRKMSK